ncbi:DUF488 family protein [Flavobacterium sp. UMI-01]|uniref:DUF488 domain-containing protein n=1 Tax=Flavobacterium sp. UMI-01 TaxID=1441053 RepID=UPI001C7D8115|nr:DUF488 domain-containing protein [Flavobacterium sp. UMI-01]GIZ10168.1 hypothetical protein FUMI01_28940 [Flavobacterium sp. UMI-01]
MFYRRKIILALLQLFEGQIDKISLQKLLFLFTQRQKKADYDFIPYKYGCYSYSANADLTAMVRKGMLSETASHFSSNEITNYFNTLKVDDKRVMLYIKEQYGKMNADTLMKHTYLNFPYWAINSLKAQEILTTEQLKKVDNSRPKSNKTILFTIGYEGISLEEYLNRLLKNDIKILVDVRNNPLSMKYGFSKSQLQRYCNSLGIDYIHFPEVGIQSQQRQELNTQSDYDKLFAIYCENNLTKTTSSQEKILNLLKENKRIALTCFESNICQCHRKHLAEAIENLPNFEYEVKHI